MNPQKMQVAIVVYRYRDGWGWRAQADGQIVELGPKQPYLDIQTATVGALAAQEQAGREVIAASGHADRQVCHERGIVFADSRGNRRRGGGA